jgi:penicillin-binding protein 2
MASLIGTVAVSGARYQPRVVKAFRKHDTGRVYEFPTVGLGNVGLHPQTFATLRSALRRVVSDPEGTGRGAFLDWVSIGGKTGTSQVVSNRPGTSQEGRPKEFQDHAWFVAFAPVEDPRIAVAVLVEHGGRGGRVAAPLARKIIEEYLKNDRTAADHKL